MCTWPPKPDPEIPQTVLALWGSGVFKAGDCPPGFPASRTFADIPGHGKSLKNNEFINIFKKNGAGARVLESTISFFDECFS